ncbi:MAG: FxsA family protein [Actinobacteria bacterium]|nr:FxsA family protein [Actinomycetota bacterium]
MFLLLLVLFLVTPIVELYLIVQVAGGVGLLNTIALLFLVSAVGAWLVRREGLGILRRAQDEMAQGRVPGRQLVDGLLVLFGGALMLTPGFATDALGLSLLFPPTRALLRVVASRWFGRRMSDGNSTMAWRVDLGGHGGHGHEGPIDVESWRDDDPPSRPELGGSA